MDETEKTRFRELLHDKFNNNLKAVNDALVKYLEIVERGKEANTSAYQNIKIMKTLSTQRRTTTHNTTTNTNKNC